MAKNQSNGEVSVRTRVKISQAIRMVLKSIKVKLVPMVHGSPAIGKSGIMQQIAEEYNLFLIDLRLSQCDPTDLMGFPQINAVLERAGYVPMDTFPIEGECLPAYRDAEGKEVIEDGKVKRYNGWLLFLDEFNSASVAVQAASYKIVLDRMVGKYHLHKNVAVVCAGNLETDGAIVEQMSTALQSRLVHMELEVDAPEWVKWAIKKQIDHRIISFIEFQPKSLYTFRPDHTDWTYASPRTWEFANRYVKEYDVTDPDLKPLLDGTITAGVTHEFLMFCTIFQNLPSIHDIVTAPEGIRVSNEPSILYAISGSMAHHATTENIGQLMKYIKRLPVEFQIVCVRMTLGRNADFVNNAEVQKWLEKHAVDLF
jgi:hypothetical protein